MKRDQAHETAIHSIVTELGGVDYEGFPTSRLNYLQRIRILREKERRLDDAIEDAKDWKAEALKWKKLASASLSLCNERMRPDSEGWWWRRARGTRSGDQWEIGKAEMIQWDESGEPVQERVLAWSTGGSYSRCDYINLRTDSGTRWIKVTPPMSNT